jgi:RNA polymerase sigma factor (sigma-70 family)
VEALSATRPHARRFTKPRRVLAALSDERLVEHVRRGDEVAFEILYDRHHRGVLSFCRHMLRSPDEAEDAVQHTFIAAYNDLQRDDERDIRFKAWLYTIARNRCLSVLRARREQVSDEIELVTDRLSDDVQQRADLQALVSDINELPDEQREALVLSEVGDLSHAEVAAIIGCEAAKVKSLVFQARTALIERRDARETPCEEIREQLATLRGGALRRSHLRHHLKACPGCTQYREEVRRQRQLLALALPVVPSLGLRSQVLAAVGLGGGASGAAGVVGGGLGLAAKSGLAKVGIAAVVAAGAAGGTAVVATHGDLPVVRGFTHHDANSGAAPGATPASQRSASGAAAVGHDTKSSVTAAGKGHRSASGTEHGFTPVQGQSNGAAARQFALTRGKGKHSGITKTHHATTRVRKAKRVRRHAVVKQTTPRTTRPAPAKPAPTQTTEPAPTTTTTAPSTPTPPPDGNSGNGGGAGGGKGNVGVPKLHGNG